MILHLLKAFVPKPNTRAMIILIKMLLFFRSVRNFSEKSSRKGSVSLNWLFSYIWKRVLWNAEKSGLDFLFHFMFIWWLNSKLQGGNSFYPTSVCVEHEDQGCHLFMDSICRSNSRYGLNSKYGLTVQRGPRRHQQLGYKHHSSNTVYCIIGMLP